MVYWPPWWSWDLELTPHVERRMEDRGFTEVDLRATIHRVQTRHRGAAREVIVEPAPDESLLVVITAYRARRT